MNSALHPATGHSAAGRDSLNSLIDRYDPQIRKNRKNSRQLAQINAVEPQYRSINHKYLHSNAL
jgi:hypothetical protein